MRALPSACDEVMAAVDTKRSVEYILLTCESAEAVSAGGSMK